MLRFRRLFPIKACRDPVAQMRRMAAIHPDAVLYSMASIVLNGHPGSRINVGAHSHIRGELLLFGHGGRISVGEYCYIGEQTRLWSGAEIKIGDRVLVAHHVTIMDNTTHPMNAQARHTQFRQIITTGQPRDIDLGDRPVTIEDDAWIGCQCVIMRGVTIGAGAVVAAGSIVTRDVPAGMVVAGNPARVIRSVEEGSAEDE